jgi:hypothetical protein
MSISIVASRRDSCNDIHIPSTLVHSNRRHASERAEIRLRHLRSQAAAMCSYHRLQYTQTVAMPAREQIFDCSISVA